ncbi:hypothetical protein SERLA73DRAFT_63965, partial [Serpula lacrymans var. lacrymans S7.3]
QARLSKGAALSPVIIATEKTQLMQFSDSKFAYPVYLTLGNIPRAIQWRPSQHACILLATCLVQRLFHESMKIILDPLKKVGRDGIEVVGGDGAVRRVYSVLVCYVADYPEQCLVTCSKYGTCPKCKQPPEELLASTAREPHTDQWTESVINKAKEDTHLFYQFQERCKEQLVSGSVYKPFWTRFPHCNIHIAITPDVLHQLFQGIFKHMVHWCQKILDPKELDACIRALPSCFGVRYFKDGFSALGQIGGKERKDMAKILFGCLIG